MACFHDRTPARAPQRGLLPSADLVLDYDLVTEIRHDLDRLIVEARPELLPISLLPSQVAARAIHARRQLEGAAEHGAALLVSLGLPRLVTADFVPLDREVIGDAVDNAINLLDALDAPGEDREDGEDDEPSLGWITNAAGVTFPAGTLDVEHDTADDEPSLASPERHPTIPLSFRGHPYTARGGEEGQLRWAEGARDDREKVDEDGPIDDDELDGAGEVDAEPSIGWPEDVTAEVVFTFSAEGDAEHDDVDLEGEPAGDLTWVFGPSRREVAHV